MTLVARREALALAESAHRLAQTDPARARDLSLQALELARRERNPESQAVALHALGFARSRLGDPRALATMRRAVRVSERNGLRYRASLVQRNIAFLLAYRGDLRRAVREVDAARAGLTSLDAARTEVFRVAIYHLAGRTHEVLRSSGSALTLLRRRGDEAWEARLAYNRGVALGELGDHRAARVDLERARDLYRHLGFEAAVADAQVKLALLRALDGDPLACLLELDAVDPDCLSDWSRCWFHLHRAEALVDLRLLPEARVDLEAFAAVASVARADDSVLKARLRVARLTLLAGDRVAAGTLARSARRSFSARGQAPFAAAAGLLAFETTLSLRRPDARAIRMARSAVELLETAGWMLDALRGRLLLARAEAERGALETARLELAAATPLERAGTTADRIALRHAKAVTLAAGGSHDRAERALRSGLMLLEDYRAALGAADARVAASLLGEELANLGLRLASRDGDPERMLAWAESLRANTLRLPASEPSSDPVLRESQIEIRLVARQQREAVASGRATAALAARQANLERLVAERSRLVRGRPPSMLDTRRRPSSPRAEVVVEYVARDGVLDAVIVKDRVSLERLGSFDVSGDLDWLRFALRRLARDRLDARGRRATLDTAQAAARALDDRLVKPLLHSLGDGPLVVVPTGELHAIPWAALPSLRGRPLTVCPSLATFTEISARNRRRTGTSSFVAGPRLRHARGEVIATRRHVARRDPAHREEQRPWRRRLPRSTVHGWPTSPVTDDFVPTTRCSPRSSSSTVR